MLNLDYAAEKVLDVEVLNELDALGSGQEGEGLVAALFVVFERTATETLAAIESAAQSHDHKAFGESVHKLKGSSGSIGALALYGCCKAVDALYKAASLDDDEMISSAAVIGRELKRANAALGEYVQRCGASSGAPLGMSAVTSSWGH